LPRWRNRRLAVRALLAGPRSSTATSWAAPSRSPVTLPRGLASRDAGPSGPSYFVARGGVARRDLALALAFFPYLRQCDESRAQPGELRRRESACELLVDGFDCVSNRLCRRPPALGQDDLHPATIVGIDVPLEVAPEDEDVDQLARGLLGDAELSDEVAQ